MTVEEKVEYLEEKLNEVIELLKFMIQVDDSINIKNANILLRSLDELNEE